VKPTEIKKETAGGILLPDESTDVLGFAIVVCEVISVGEECYADENKFRTHWAKPGMHVLIGKFSGAKFWAEKEEYRILNDDEILAEVPDPTTVSAIRGL